MTRVGGARRDRILLRIGVVETIGTNHVVLSWVMVNKQQYRSQTLPSSRQSLAATIINVRRLKQHSESQAI